MISESSWATKISDFRHPRVASSLNWHMVQYDIVYFIPSLSPLCPIPILNKITPNSPLSVLTIQANNGNNSDGAPFTVFTKNRFDREKRAGYEFSVTCHLMSNGSRDSLDTTIPGELTILDQNDSPIVSQSNETLITFFFKLSNDNYRAVSNSTHKVRFLPHPINLLFFSLCLCNRVNLSHHVRSSEPSSRWTMTSRVSIESRWNPSTTRRVWLIPTLKLWRWRLTILKMWTSCQPCCTRNSVSFFYRYFFRVITNKNYNLALSKNVSTVHRWKGEYCVASNLLDTAQVIRHEPVSHKSYRFLISFFPAGFSTKFFFLRNIISWDTWSAWVGMRKRKIRPLFRWRRSLRRKSARRKSVQRSKSLTKRSIPTWKLLPSHPSPPVGMSASFSTRPSGWGSYSSFSFCFSPFGGDSKCMKWVKWCIFR